jgi:hypothetical protein
MRLDVQHHIQVAGRAAARGGLALTGQPELDAFVGALRHVDLDCRLGPYHALTVTLDTRI